jgi:hypothetical protein
MLCPAAAGPQRPLFDCFRRLAEVDGTAADEPQHRLIETHLYMPRSQSRLLLPQKSLI